MDLLSICKDLIRIPSVTGDMPHVHEVLAYIQNLCQDPALTVRILEAPGISPVFYATNNPNKNPDIAILGHLDVVPAEPSQFQPLEKEGCLYGRGALDMKSFAAIACQNLLTVVHENTPLTIAIVLETDEEIGSSGMHHFIETHPDFIPDVILDVDVGGDITHIIDKCKSPQFIRLEARGESAHGSAPWNGIDANERLMWAIASLRAKYPYYAKDGHTPDDTWVNTMHVGKIKGGETVNIISDFCTADLDFRLTPDFAPDRLYQDLDRSMPPGVSWSVISSGSAVVVNRNHPAVQCYQKTTEKVLGRPIVFCQTGGATTSRLLAEKGSVIIYHSGTGSGMHGADEYVEIDSLNQLALVQLTFLREYALIKSSGQG